MKLKIVSDGTPGKTAVINEATGEPLDGIHSISWECDQDIVFTRLSLVVDGVAVQMTGTAIDGEPHKPR